MSLFSSIRGRNASILLVFAVMPTLFTGCRRDRIEVYRVAKEPAPQSASIPPGWEPAPAGQMRVASFTVKGQGGKVADVSVIPLPGMGGTDLANVNRWRDQLGLEPVTEADLGQLGQPVQIGGLNGQLYDLLGQPAGSPAKVRMLAAMVRKDDVPWFFKMTGDDQLVAEQKNAFVSYLRGFQFSQAPSSETASASGPGQLPANHPDISGSAAGAPSLAGSPQTSSSSSGSGKPAWKVPSDWQETQGGQFLVAKFLVPGPNNSQAAINVSSSGGNGGGLLMNVNRWRQQQLGLSEVDEAGAKQLATPLDVPGGKAMLVDMTGNDPRSGDKVRMVAVIAPHDGQTWFYKLMGPLPVVEQEKDKFIKFVQSAQYSQ